jgi:hypothetical protein
MKNKVIALTLLAGALIAGAGNASYARETLSKEIRDSRVGKQERAYNGERSFLDYREVRFEARDSRGEYFARDDGIRGEEYFVRDKYLARRESSIKEYDGALKESYHRDGHKVGHDGHRIESRLT